MSYILSSLKGALHGIRKVTCIGVVQSDTSSLDPIP